ncbi:M81 family metallopeptidase [Aquabacterium sp. OR-4]|uniref:M81 family metallopeptidase n=1 Tax=Aquabacterium sp. OR-4 TaxID=2978127 RepID=UPI0021B46FA1|nr:M81 family metallopeptidase [Aquabacterium sp. OR-4]MDT7837736.1 M81 family metallopeptidase [Aquabacterium sp. OR-4]
MQLLIARLNHETNTFSPVPTPLAAFDPQWDDDARRSQQGMRTAMAAFLDAAARRGDTVLTPLAATANPSGRVDAAAYERMAQHIEACAPGCDAILLDLHGAMVTTHLDDGEGELLARLRAAAPGVPIGVALDLHGNITPRMMANADVMVGFKTYPHVDMYETGEHAARLLLAMADGQVRYALRWHRLALMSHTLRSATLGGDSAAMTAAVASAREAEGQGVPAVTVFAGFALADIPAPCVSVVVTDTDDTAGHARAQRTADGLAQQVWAQREGFVYRSEPLAQSLARATALAEAQPESGPHVAALLPPEGALSPLGRPGGTDSGPHVAALLPPEGALSPLGRPGGTEATRRPVLLLDHGDNVMSGGTCDTMDVLLAALAAGMSGIAMGPLCDPEAVATLWAAGEGARLTLALGNKRAMPALRPGPGREKTPPLLSGTVRRLSDGVYTVTGPIYTGQRCEMGRTVLFDIGAAQIVVTERTQEPYDLGVFGCVGLDVAQRPGPRFVLLKSRMYCRPVFGPLCAALVECDSAGVTSSDYSLYPFTQVQRPVYPLDAG